MFVVEYFDDGEWVVLGSSAEPFDAVEAAETCELHYEFAYRVRVRFVED